MHAYVFLVTGVVAVLASSDQQLSNDTLEVCWRDSYPRGVGTIPNQCKEGEELDAGLCYKNCAANYTGVGPVCWENCPPGYNDIGALCSIPPSTYYECPWYDVCGITFAKGCLGPCDEGYEMVACSCYRPGKTIAKGSYGRGVGVIPICASDQSESGGLCYEICKDGYIGDGPVCWQNESGSANYTIQCNPFAYGQTEADCKDLRDLLIHAGITTPLCLGALALSIATGHIVGPKYCVNLIKNVLPALAKTPVCG